MPDYTPIIIRSNGHIDGASPANGEVFTLEELKAIVGGHIEMVSLADGRMMTLNEEGKLLGLPFNPIATGLFNKGGRVFFDPIAGDVLVCPLRWLESDDGGDDFEYGDEYDSLRESDDGGDDGETPLIDRASTDDTPADASDLGDTSI